MEAVTASVEVPAGYCMTWSGQYENMLRVRERLKLVIPLTLVLIFGLLYMNTKSAFKAGLVMLAVPFSAIGAVWLLWPLYPAVYFLWKRREVMPGPATPEASDADTTPVPA